MRYTFVYEGYGYRGGEPLPKVGDRVLVYSRENIMTGKEHFCLSVRFAEHGYPGNLDNGIRCFHGWRGTTNNIATYAHGVYSVASVSVKHNGDAVVKINRTDLARGKE